MHKMTNRALKEIHESMTDAYQAGIIDLSTMQKYDKLCMIDAHEMLPEEIRHIRKDLVKYGTIWLYQLRSKP